MFDSGLIISIPVTVVVKFVVAGKGNQCAEPWS